MRLRRKLDPMTLQRPVWERPETVADRPAVIHAARAGDAVVADKPAA